MERMRKRFLLLGGIIALMLLASLIGCKEEEIAFVTFEQAVENHEYYLVELYNDPTWPITLDDITWIIDSLGAGYDCEPPTYFRDGFCYNYRTVIFTIGNPQQAYVKRSDVFIWIKDDPAGWQYANWL